MKKLFFAVFAICIPAFFAFPGGIAEDSSADREKSDMSYAFGMYMAWELEETELEFDFPAFTRGFRDAMESRGTRFTENEAIEILQAAFERQQLLNDERAKAEGEKNLIEGLAFLAENSLEPGIVVTPSGLQIEILEEGDGKTPGMDDTVRVHYRGTLIDGSVFDTSYEHGEPMTFPLNIVIPGWAEGLTMMKEGGKAMLYIPPDLAYGEIGAGSIVPPNAVLIFEVELLKVADVDSDFD